jgi:serine/threonine-protein kinase HipA
MAGRLAVWLHGVKVAQIDQQRRRLRLVYTDEALRRYALGIPLLSLSLPLSGQRYAHDAVAAFLDGLLPEADARRAMARDVGVTSIDTYGLIGAAGRDCAGALVIQPDVDPAPPQPTTLTAEPLTAAGLAELIANLRTAPLGMGGRVRISLAGVQEKLLLTRMPDGGWGRPVDGTPSTHILKPEVAGLQYTVQNEAFSMRFARHLGLPTAKIEILRVDGRELIVVERYDRIIHPDGSVVRLHQEDFCQAAGLPPERKYEQDGGPSLRRVAGMLQGVASRAGVEALLRAVVVNVLIGNGDAHAKNLSLLHYPAGSMGLAPLYDLMSTVRYGDERLAMSIDGVEHTRWVTADHLVREATGWGMAGRRATEIITEVLTGAAAAIERAASESSDVPAEIPEFVSTRLAQLSSEVSPRSV